MKFKVINDEENQKCAPSRIYDGYSCFSFKSLKIIADAYNKHVGKDHKNYIKINNIKSKEELVKILHQRIEYCNENQLCWYDQPWFKKIKDYDIKYNTFRPVGPLEKYKWLNTTNINNILNQYEHKYTDFLFLGAVPIDFEEISFYNIKNIDFDDLVKDNKTKLGMVINLDEHWQSGSHWVALYADLIKNHIYYFDSYGTKPNKRVIKFMLKIAIWCYNRNLINNYNNINYNMKNFLKNIKNKYNDALDIRYNKFRHQYKNSECGVYSINFILRLLKGDTFDQITNERTNDDNINTCRTKYFTFYNNSN